MACYKDEKFSLTIMKKSIFTMLVVFCCAAAASPDAQILLQYPEQETEEILQEKEELGQEVQQIIADLQAQLRRLHYLLSQITSEETAAAYTKEVQGALQGLRGVDLSIFENEDEERIASEFSTAFTLLEEEGTRLMENDYYGNQVLKTLLEEGDSPIYTIGH